MEHHEMFDHIIPDITHEKPSIIVKIEQEAMKPCLKSPVNHPADHIAVSKSEYRQLKQAEQDGWRPKVPWQGTVVLVDYTLANW